MFYVVTPSWNYGRFLPDAIASVRAQEVDVLHHIQDGESSDDTLEVVHDLRWPGLRFEQTNDTGMCDALNKGFGKAPERAMMFGWLNADEYYAHGALAAVAAAFDRDPSLDVVYGDSMHVNREGRIVRLVAQHAFSRTVLRSMTHLYIQTGSTFFRRRVWESGNLVLDEAFKQGMDQELFVKLDDRGFKFGYVPQVLSYFRLHSDQLTSQNGAAVAERDFLETARRYQYRARPALGRAAHRARKLMAGSYYREVVSVPQRRGKDSRWFSHGAER